MSVVIFCFLLFVLGVFSVQGRMRLGAGSSEEDDIASFNELAELAEFDELATGSVLSHTSGFLVSLYKDLGADPKSTVEVEVQQIGVCYPTNLSPVEFTKLTKIEVNKDTKDIILTRHKFTDSDCTRGTGSSPSTETLRIREKMKTNHGVEITIKRKFTELKEKALTPPEELGSGSIVSFFGVEPSCAGEPFQFLLLTDKCSNFLVPDFFGRVRCSQPGRALTFEEDPFNYDRACPRASGGTDLKTQPFACSNQGTGQDPDYQTAACLPPKATLPRKAPPKMF